MFRLLTGVLLFGALQSYASADFSALPPDSVPEEIISVDSLNKEFNTAKTRELQELIVKRKHRKYSKKNNPAVDLMRKVRRDYPSLDPSKREFYSYDKYEKIQIGISEFNHDFIKPAGKGNSRLSFMQQYIDTAPWTGSRILNLGLKEKNSKVLDGENRGNKFEVIKGFKSEGIDDAINQDNTAKVIGDIIREINPYSNDITLLQNRFVGPLSAIGADYYMYEITDTLPVGGEECIELSFYPHNPESMGFNGKLYIATHDSLRYVKRATMRLPKASNVNYIHNLFISQNFEIDSTGMLNKTLDDVCIEFRIMPKTPVLYSNRVTHYSGFSNEDIPEFSEYSDRGGESISLSDAHRKSARYWNELRPVPLTSSQEAMGSMMTKMRKIPFLYWTEKVLLTLINGYITTGNPSKFDIGPVNTILSYNTAEGLRIRGGGLTTVALSPRVFGRGYVAYGFKDRKVKYSGELEYSFVDKKYGSREFPVNSIRATYNYDIDQLGQHYLFTNADNMFLSLKRMSSDLITYRRLAKLEYNLELLNNFSLGIELHHEKQESTSWVPFIDGEGNHFRYCKQSGAKITLRYAPGEKFVQGVTGRAPINMDAPIFLLTHEFGPKGFLGSDFTLNKTEFSAQKRFWFSAFGYTDIILKAGAIWSKVQFPVLLWQNANLSYTIQPESYSLLNPMEFAMDKYASLDMQYYMNGLIFNRLPLIKKLKLREVLTFKGFYGSLSKKNNPEFNADLFRFPLEAKTRPMGKQPYMELGVGIDNILTILRVDYVWRLTYRDLPGIDKSGLRVSLHFSF